LQLHERIKAVVASVFELSEGEVTEDMALGRTKNWDSLRHMNLILALEEDFGIRFSDDEVIEMISVALIAETLREKLSS
jgi:acyl carrier protein